MKKNLAKKVTLGILAGAMLMTSSVAWAYVGTGNGSSVNTGTFTGQSEADDNSVAVGVNAKAYGTYDIAIGANVPGTDGGSTQTVSNGSQSIAIGYAAVAGTSGKSDIAIGGESVAQGMDSIAIGGNAVTNNNFSVALGYDTKVYAHNSVALGYGSVAQESQVVSVGSGTLNGNAPQYRKIINVADGSADHDAATVGQMKTYVDDALAKVSGGGNVDAYTKAETDGKFLTQEAAKSTYVALSSNDAGNNQPNISIDSDGQMVFGATSSWIGGNGEGFFAGTIDSNQGHTADNAKASMTEDGAIKGASGAFTVDTSGNVTAANLYTKTEVDTKLDTKANAATTLAGYGIADAYTKTEVDTKLDTKANAADVYTKTEADSLLGDKADKATTLSGYGITDAYTKTDIDTMIGGSTQDISALESRADTMQQDLSDLNAEVVKTNDHFNTEIQKTNDHFNTELGNTNRQVVANAQGIAANSTAISGLSQRLDRTDSKLNKVGAGAAALAALHPLDYDPDNKLQFSAGVGRYEGETAAAIGAFFHADEDVMFSLGGTVGGGENMMNLGVSFAVGKGASGVAKLSKAELVDKVRDMETKYDALDAENNELRHEINHAKGENQKLQDRIAKLEELVMKLAGK